MEGRRLYPIGIQTFSKLREGNYVYVDKTELVYRMTHGASGYIFLSRPRRFGKSLLTSTLHSYFEGRKDLFEGLAIEHLEKEWTSYPVLHFDMSTAKHMDKDRLLSELERKLYGYEQIYGRDESAIYTNQRLESLIQRAYAQTGQKVVALIDEYDAPLLDVVHEEKELPKLRDVMRNFYSPLKACDPYLRFVFLTGITKFSQLSIFSELNNIKNISMLPEYAAICGITEEEIATQMDEDLDILAGRLNVNCEEVVKKLKAHYDGYHFTWPSPDIYNPFSLLNTFKYMRPEDYWFETGTPSYLVELLKHTHYALYELANTETDADVLNSIDSTSSNPVPVIYQSGYLTIKDYDSRFGIYKLGFPNLEVEEGFVKYLLPFYTSVSAPKTPFEIGRFVREVENGDYDAFFRRLQSFFADTPYEVIAGQKPERDTELHYQNVLFIVFRLIGLYAKVEYHTSNGRIDLVVQTDRYIYIMEFKLNGSAEDALRQIDEKRYALPFANDGRKVFKIGVNFSSETRNIERWVVE